MLWASQTGNAEEFAGRLGDRLGDARLRSMDDADLAELADGARGRSSSPAPSVTAARPTTAPTSGTGSSRRTHPSLAGVRYAVLGIGDRSYDNFCGHAKSLDARLADLGATRLLDRAECEAYDDAPMAQWADRGASA